MTATSPAGEPRDPGLPPERTRLSWRRTALGAMAVTLLTLRLALHSRPAVGVPAAAGALGFLLTILLVTHRRIGAMAASRPVAVGRSLTVVASCVVGYAILGVLLVTR